MDRKNIERTLVAAFFAVMVLLCVVVVIQKLAEQAGQVAPTATGGGSAPAYAQSLNAVIFALAIAGFCILIAIGGIKYIGRDNVMERPVRAAIYKYIQEHPGAHLHKICDALDLNVTNATWHLRKLKETHYISEKKEGKFLKYYPLERQISGNSRDFT